MMKLRKDEGQPGLDKAAERLKQFEQARQPQENSKEKSKKKAQNREKRISPKNRKERPS